MTTTIHTAPRFFTWAIRVVIALCLAYLVAAVLLTPAHAQAATPFANTSPSVPPAIGTPGVSLAFDTTNKLLVVTFSTANATGTISTLTTIAYNPRAIEGTGGAVVSFAGVAVILQHNLPTDTLLYQVGASNAAGTIVTMQAQCSRATPLPTGVPACPAIPW